jgi:hypothetical protein
MEEIIPRLFEGNDEAYEKTKGRAGWSYLRAAKYGPGGHKEILGYSTPGAPPGKNYLWVRKGNLLALNILDLDDPEMIPEELIFKGLDFIHERLAAGDKVLVACNFGHSRSASLVLMYLRAIGEMPHAVGTSMKLFKKFYPTYSPNHGMEFWTRKLWNELKDKYLIGPANQLENIYARPARSK